MALLNILQFPDPRLKEIALPVEIFDQTLLNLIDDMFETMYEAQGVGLAATQINVQKQVIVMDISEERNQPIHLINPQIIKKENMIEWEEGCLSFSGVYGKVNRSQEIEIQFLDKNGKQKSLHADGGLLSACIQHEIDHLNGITFYDHLSPLKQQLLRKKLSKVKSRTL